MAKIDIAAFPSLLSFSDDQLQNQIYSLSGLPKSALEELSRVELERVRIVLRKLSRWAKVDGTAGNFVAGENLPAGSVVRRALDGRVYVYDVNGAVYVPS